MKCIKNKVSGIKIKISNIALIINIIKMINDKDIIKYLVSWTIICMMSSLSYVCTTWRMQVFFDSFESNTLVGNLILLGIVLIISIMLSGLSVWGDEIVEKKLIKVFILKYHDKIASLDSEKLEDPEFVNYLNRCEKGIVNVAYIAQSFFFMLTWHAPYFTFMGVYLCRSNYLFLLIFLFMILGTALTQLLKSKFYVALKTETSDSGRQIKYYEQCIFDTIFCKETRTLNLEEMFKKKFNESIMEYNGIYKSCNCKINKVDFACRIIMALTYILIVIILIENVMKSAITIGTFTAILASIERIEIMIRSMLISNLGYMSENLAGAFSYVELMRSKDKNRMEIELSDDDSIRLDNISFTYPNSLQEALHGISFSIIGNEKIVIVGENGSGKSTLAKILIGLYYPSTGSITIGGKLIEIPYHIDNSTAVFQDFCRYKLDINDNIWISDPPECTSMEPGKIFASTEKKIRDLSDLLGLDNMQDSHLNLSPEFGGKDISGGMWQRVAIARGIYRKSKFIVLDEPTAAIDPSEEEKIFNIYSRLSEGRKSIIISHRLGITRGADKIIVMKEGKIVGIGTHSDLLATNEEYQALWFSQAKFYMESTEGNNQNG